MVSQPTVNSCYDIFWQKHEFTFKNNLQKYPSVYTIVNTDEEYGSLML